MGAASTLFEERPPAMAVARTPPLVSISSDFSDSSWDAFLECTPLGQFQQSAAWARAKAGEGWQPLRATWTVGAEAAGGVQMLWRPTRLGRIGYISKGPVLAEETREAAAHALSVVQTLAQRHRLRALIIQPPDDSVALPPLLDRAPFASNCLTRVNDATLTIDVGRGFDAVEHAMSRVARQNARQAARRGVEVREGGEADLPTFFDLMARTCERQAARPNPASPAALIDLWRALSERGRVRLTLAFFEGRPIAGLLCVAFGRMVNLWKKGWASTDAKRHPNELLTYEALQWAATHGYKTCDFAAVDRGIAESLLRGAALTPEQMQTRHFFNVRFGAEAKLLPLSRVYIPNQVARWGYEVLGQSPWWGRLAERISSI